MTDAARARRQARQYPAMVLATLLAVTGPGAVVAQEVPGFMDVVAGAANQSLKSDIDRLDEALGDGMVRREATAAERKVIELNNVMFGIYDNNLKKFIRNLREQSPVIVGLFNGDGGSMILYPPGKAPIVAPPVAPVYRLVKSVSHSSMAIFQLVAAALRNPAGDTSWREPATAYRASLNEALGSLDSIELKPEQREVLRELITRNIAFLDACLSKGSFTYPELEAFAQGLRPLIGKTTEIAGLAQVQHWTTVLKDWRLMLGADWERTYAVTNTLYVTRRNNILFTLLAQQMGREAINTRLLLLETSAFTTKPQQMLELLARIVADRALGKVFFNDYYLMDSELLTDGTRKAMADLAAQAGEEVMLPPLAPFLSNAWPWQTSAEHGRGPSQIDWK
ncbi:MAG: hypothetical protein QHC89_08515 [Bosea sp. (in: a-proteobacteria)]|nr:hypothetical protein [Bosea sp. (in: a-proteobacteria)]